ncbi:lytic transglycosylase domain-containing protein [Plastoroseomonas arctica]|uniref:Lytic transglycosylase domain-containing protein n=1 Tax=Plastoroseomonas arctica TaxID=1509237 RepID=A0AAF1KHX8_9PROT|nr:lytic transglycosylase domain-containing protein [Plastoroseomonas arctica]MBR0653940.1 lytic transglycosylase domain-containing protein [Plastoroseomonas arctica]
MQRAAPRAFLIALALVSGGAAAQPVDPWSICRPAIEQASNEAGIPAGMMAAIARVESGRREPLSGRVEPWPWAINAGGEGRYANSQAEAIILVQEYAARGVRSVDVGCMQINLMHHPLAFASLAEAFDPLANARYAARFLRQLQAQVGWDAAIGRYHSATAERAQPYRERVLAAMAGRPIPAGGGAAPVRDWYTVMLSPAAALVRVEGPTPRRRSPSNAPADLRVVGPSPVLPATLPTRPGLPVIIVMGRRR